MDVNTKHVHFKTPSKRFITRFNCRSVLTDLTTWWEIPCIAQFVSIFRLVFNLPELEIEELEEAFVADGAPGGSPLLQEIMVSLVQGCVPGRRISAHNWEEYLYRILKKTWVRKHHRENPISDIVSFSELNVRTKVEIVYFLCYYRLDRKDAKITMKSVEAESLRVQALGRDRHGNVYWYFYGTRLYKEGQPKNAPKKSWEDEWDQEIRNGKAFKKKGPGRPRKSELKNDSESSETEQSRGSFLTLDTESPWSIVCSTIEDWQKFADSLVESQEECEIELHEIIRDNFLPSLAAIYEEKELHAKRKKSKDASRERSLSNKKQRKSADFSDRKKHKRNRSRSLSASKSTVNEMDRSRKLGSRHRTPGEKKFMKEVPVPIRKIKNSEKIVYRDIVSEQIMDWVLQKGDDLYPKLGEVLAKVREHEDSWPFLNPVDEAFAPKYYTKIKNPIDIATIERKVRMKGYQNIREVESDIERMVRNCRIYNGKNHCYTGMAENVSTAFYKAVLRVFVNPGESANPENGANDSIEEFRTRTQAQTACTIRGMFSKNANSKPKKKRSKKKSRFANMQEGLAMLAEASEQAVKYTSSSSGGESPFGESNALNSKEFPSLKIKQLQNHPPELIAKYSSGDSDCSRDRSEELEMLLDNSNLCAEIAEGTISGNNDSPSDLELGRVVEIISCSPDSSYREKDPVMPNLLPAKACDKNGLKSNLTVLAGGNSMSPDSCNLTGVPRSVSRDSSSSVGRLSNSDTDQSISFLDLEQSYRTLCTSSEITKSDVDNFSSILFKMIKENQGIELPVVAGSDVAAVTNGYHRSSPNNSVPSSGSMNRSPTESETFYSPSHDNSVRSSPKLDIVPTYSGVRSLRDITTIDASSLGLSSSIECKSCDDKLASQCSPQGQLSPKYEDFQAFHPVCVDNQNFECDAIVVSEEKHDTETNKEQSTTSHFSHLSEALRDLSYVDEDYVGPLVIDESKEQSQNECGCGEICTNENVDAPPSSFVQRQESDDTPMEASETDPHSEVPSENPAAESVHESTEIDNVDKVPHYIAPNPSLGSFLPPPPLVFPDSSLPQYIPVSSATMPMFSNSLSETPNFTVTTGPVGIVPPMPQPMQSFRPPISSLSENETFQAPAYVPSAFPLKEGFVGLPKEITSPISTVNKQPKRRKRMSTPDSGKNRPIFLSSMTSSNNSPSPSAAASPHSQSPFTSSNDNPPKPVQFFPPPTSIHQVNCSESAFEAPTVYSSGIKENLFSFPQLVNKELSTPATTATMFAPFPLVPNTDASARFPIPETGQFWNQNIGPFYNIPLSSLMSQSVPMNANTITGFTANGLPIMASAMSVPTSRQSEQMPKHTPEQLPCSIAGNVAPNISISNAYRSLPMAFAKVLDTRNGFQQPMTTLSDSVSFLPGSDRPYDPQLKFSEDMPPRFMIGPRFQAGVSGQQGHQHPRFFNIPPGAPPVMISTQSSPHGLTQMPYLPTTSLSSIPIDANGTLSNGAPAFHLPMTSRTLPVYTILSSNADKPPDE